MRRYSGAARSLFLVLTGFLMGVTGISALETGSPLFKYIPILEHLTALTATHHHDENTKVASAACRPHTPSEEIFFVSCGGIY